MKCCYRSNRKAWVAAHRTSLETGLRISSIENILNYGSKGLVQELWPTADDETIVHNVVSLFHKHFKGDKNGRS